MYILKLSQDNPPHSQHILFATQKFCYYLYMISEKYHKTYHNIVALIFTAVAVLHGARIVYGWQAFVGGAAIPFWVSWVALIISIYLAYRGFSFTKK